MLFQSIVYSQMRLYDGSDLKVRLQFLNYRFHLNTAGGRSCVTSMAFKPPAWGVNEHPCLSWPLAADDITAVTSRTAESDASGYPFNLPGASPEVVHCCHPCSPRWCCAAICITPEVCKNLTYLLGSASKVDPTSYFLQVIIIVFFSDSIFVIWIIIRLYISILIH